MAYTEFHQPPTAGSTFQFMTPEAPQQQRSKNFVFVNNDESRPRKNKIQRSCNECRKRKIRCESATTERWPCSHCMKIGVECTRPTPFEHMTYAPSNGQGVANQAPQYLTPRYTFDHSPFSDQSLAGQAPMPFFPMDYGVPGQFYPGHASPFLDQHNVQHAPTFIAPMPIPQPSMHAPNQYLALLPLQPAGVPLQPAQFHPAQDYAMPTHTAPMPYHGYMQPAPDEKINAPHPEPFAIRATAPAWQPAAQPVQPLSAEDDKTRPVHFTNQEVEPNWQAVSHPSQLHPSADNNDTRPVPIVNPEAEPAWRPVPHPSQASSADTGDAQPTRLPSTPPTDDSEVQFEVEVEVQSLRDEPADHATDQGHIEHANGFKDDRRLYDLQIENEELINAFKGLAIPGDNPEAKYIMDELKTEVAPIIDEPDFDYKRSVGPGGVIRIDPEMMPSEIDSTKHFEFYFDCVHPYLPVINPPDFWRQWHTQREKISPLLLAGMFACVGYLNDDKTMGSAWLNFGSRHQKFFEDAPRLSTLQATLLLLKAEEFNPRRGYHYRTWTTMSSIVAMGKDLQLNEHLELHRSGMCPADAEGECIVRARCWYIIFMLELMIGGAQGRKSWGVSVDTVDVDNEVIFESQDEHERLITANFSYFLRSIRTVRKANYNWVTLCKTEQYWARHPTFIANNAAIDAWVRDLPERHRIDFPADESPPEIRHHFPAMLHIYHYLSVLLQHRPQLTQLKQTDPAWAREVGQCYQAAKRICVLQEAVKNKYGLSGLWRMLRGAHFHMYVIITCNMIHVVAALFPPPYGPQLFPKARDFANRHMRILYDAMNSMPLSFMAAKIDPLFLFLSKNPAAQFEIRDDIQPMRGSEGPESPWTELPNVVAAAMGSLDPASLVANASMGQVLQNAEGSTGQDGTPTPTWSIGNEATDYASAHDDAEDEINLMHYERRMARWDPMPFIQTMSTIGGLYDGINESSPSSSGTQSGGSPMSATSYPLGPQAIPSATPQQQPQASPHDPSSLPLPTNTQAIPMQLQLPRNVMLPEADSEELLAGYSPTESGMAPFGVGLNVGKWGDVFASMIAKRKLSDSEVAALQGSSEQQPQQAKKPRSSSLKVEMTGPGMAAPPQQQQQQPSSRPL